MISNYDEAYSNGAFIANGDSYPARWAEAAAAFRADLPAGCRAELDLAYGPGARQRFDLFLPAGAPKGLCVFVHGGYWMRFSKDDWSHLAAGPLARGWAVALPSYTLAPEASISIMTGEIAKAISAAASRIAGPIRLAGHSAGGQLVSRMVCEPSQLPLEVLERVEQVISISGVHDLRPLLKTAMNATLKMSELEARNESPALRRPRVGARVTCWVGADERPEFIRQSELLTNIWHGVEADTVLEVVPGRHHFNIIADLADAESRLAALLAP